MEFWNVDGFPRITIIALFLLCLFILTELERYLVLWSALFQLCKKIFNLMRCAYTSWTKTILVIFVCTLWAALSPKLDIIFLHQNAFFNEPDEPSSRGVRFGQKVGQIGPKYDKSWDFEDQFSVHLILTLCAIWPTLGQNLISILWGKVSQTSK